MPNQDQLASCERNRPAQSLDALTPLRMLPAIYVLCFHYATAFFRKSELPPIIDMGYSGVTFFFILSGFLLSYNYNSVDLSDAGQRRRYMIARIARIYPVYLLSIIISIPFLIAFSPPIDNIGRLLTTGSRIALTIASLHAWVPGAACAINCPSWSISAEFFFYATLPMILPFALRCPHICLLLAVAALFLLWLIFGLIWELIGEGLALTSPDTRRDTIINLTAQFIQYFPLGRLPEFALGIILYVFWSRNAVRQSVLQLLACALLAFAAILVAQPLIPDIALSNGLTAIIWGPLILAGAKATSPIFSSPALLLLGKISFALYLLHLPVAQAVLVADAIWLNNSSSSHPWIFAISATVLSLILASLVFWLIEEPARRYIIGLWRPAKARLGAMPSA